MATSKYKPTDIYASDGIYVHADTHASTLADRYTSSVLGSDGEWRHIDPAPISMHIDLDTSTLESISRAVADELDKRARRGSGRGTLSSLTTIDEDGEECTFSSDIIRKAMVTIHELYKQYGAERESFEEFIDTFPRLIVMCEAERVLKQICVLGNIDDLYTWVQDSIYQPAREKVIEMIEKHK